MSKGAWPIAATMAVCVMGGSSMARADAAGGPDLREESASDADVRARIPNLGYAYTAYGTASGTVGVQAYGLGVVGAQSATLGGGGAVWGSPIDRLTLIGDGARDVYGNFSPSAAAVVRILGLQDDGFSLGALAKFKVEGFGIGPDKSIPSEVEAGILLSYARTGWRFDLNAIAGRGTGDDGEVDAEGRVRLARDLGRWVRVGLDGQARFRLAGDEPLLGGRTWDFAGGPQLLVGSGAFFGALTTGPTTMGVASGVGWTAIATLGAVKL
jgi:hypothetical protein